MSSDEEFEHVMRELTEERTKRRKLEVEKSLLEAGTKKLENSLQDYQEGGCDNLKGRGKIKRSKMDGVQHQNMDVSSKFVRLEFGRYYKFPDAEKVKKWDPDDPKSISQRLKKRLSFPRDQDEKFYYETKIAPLLNKAFVELRAQIVTRVKQQWMGEFDGKVEKCFRQHCFASDTVLCVRSG